MRDRNLTGAAVALACAGALFVPAAAFARPATVISAGPPASIRPLAIKILGRSLARATSPDVNAFFNGRTTIHVGDRVAFVLNGFHTVDLPGASRSDLPLLLPGPTVSGVNDAAGNPFWFNGKVPSIGLNPALLQRSRTLTYNGRNRIDSGLPLGPPRPLVVTFSKTGTYKFFCDVHPGMVGYVIVKPKAAKIPTAKQNAAAVLRTAVRDLVALKKVATHSKQPTATVSVGESTPSGGELFAMFPSTLTVKPGTVVRFHISSHSRETHTVTFGPVAYLTKLASGFQGVSFPAQGVYPSDPFQPLTLTPSSHGNGFANLGALDSDPATKQIPSSGTIDFTTPGTYHYICLIHPFMHGTIIVK